MSALKQILSKKTDRELQFYIENTDKHTDEAVWIALAELRNRNVDLPVDIKEIITDKLNTRTVKIKEENQNPWTKNVVNDQDNVPVLYSQNAIYLFSVLICVLFGSYMLAVNCGEVGKRKWPVILFGIIYTILSVVVIGYFEKHIFNAYTCNILGVIIMYQFFWKRYIGDETKYKAKSVTKPLIIALIIFIPYILFLISSTK